jgi:sulfur-oxidizing protein SoxY
MSARTKPGSATDVLTPGDASPVDGRRRWLGRCGALGWLVIVRPVLATPASLQAEIDRFTGGAVARTGQVQIDLPEIVENGNSVPVTVLVPSPMSEREHVRQIAVFTEKNPSPNVLIARFGPAAGLARLSFRMRMADSQAIVAVAELSDGSFWSGKVDVIVALAACLE